MKHLLLVTLLLTIASTANATRSRMESLGQPDTRGSFYIDDNRNVFRNTADINRFRNFATFELNDVGTGTSEGGYFSEVGDFAWGVYLGRDTAGVNSVIAGLNQASSTGLNLTAVDSTIDLYFGGDAGIEWGVNLRFGMQKNELAGSATNDFESKASTWAINAGIRTGDLGVYAGYSADKNEITGAGAAELSGGLFTVGATYALKDVTLWLQYDGGKVKTAVSDAGKQMGITVGAGHIYEISPTARLNFDLAYNYAKFEPEGGNSELRTDGLPLNIAAEVDAASWLVVRGSVKADIFGIGKTKVKVADVETTTLGDNAAAAVAGVGLNFGKLKIDGNLGVQSASLGSQGQALFSATEMFGNAAIIYWF